MPAVRRIRAVHIRAVRIRAVRTRAVRIRAGDGRSRLDRAPRSPVAGSADDPVRTAPLRTAAGTAVRAPVAGAAPRIRAGMSVPAGGAGHPTRGPRAAGRTTADHRTVGHPTGWTTVDRRPGTRGTTAMPGTACRPAAGIQGAVDWSSVYSHAGASSRADGTTVVPARRPQPVRGRSPERCPYLAERSFRSDTMRESMVLAHDA